MNNVKKILFLSLILAKAILSQQVLLPYLSQVEVYSTSQFDSIKEIYLYSYTIKNGVGSGGEVNWLEIDVNRDSVSSVVFDTVGLLYKNDRIKNTYVRTFADISNSVVPTGFPSLPQYGDGALTLNGTIMLSAKMINPGEETKGFVMSSKGLPGIRNFVAVPPFDPYDLYPKIEEVNNPDSLAEVIEIDREAVKFRGKTIGPSAPPLNFVSTIWLDTLHSYTTQSVQLGWIANQTTADKYLNYFATAKMELEANNTNGARVTLQHVLTEVNVDGTTNLTSEAYALLRYNTEYLLTKLPAQTNPQLTVKLINSTGALLTAGSLQYYETKWKDAVNNHDGTFSITTTKPTLSLRMTYAYGSQQKDNVTVGSDTVIFQTASTQVKLQDSQGNALNTGTVQYYAGAWRTFGTTANGTAAKELLANNYSFRMTYAYGSNDKSQNVNTNPVVTFQTVNAQVQLKNSQGNFLDTGTVQYYAGAWRSFGTTSNGISAKELLPKNYSFRITYAYVGNDQSQNIISNNIIVYSTVATTVTVTNNQSSPVNNAAVTYYAGAWRSFGTTNANGNVIKELLPANLTFRAMFGTAYKDVTQNTANNAVVEIQLP